MITAVIHYPAVRWHGVVRRICPHCAHHLIKAGMLVEDPTDRQEGLRMFRTAEGFTEEQLRLAAQAHHVNGESSH